jgi:hypothetical protein
VPLPRSSRLRLLTAALAAALVVPAAAVAAPPPTPPAPAAADGIATAAAAVATSGADAVEEPVDARVVVAVIDEGINPLHDFFAVESSSVTPAVRAELGIADEQIIDVVHEGDFDERLERIEAQLDAVEPGVPYWFKGTNIVGISFSSNGLRPDQGGTHGIGTAASVLSANPEAVVVLVEGINSEAEAWAFEHPAVDLVSTSYGPIGSLPLGEHLSNSYTGVVERGKLHFGAVDNTPALSPFDATGGPWWSIGVAGYEEGDAEGRQLLSGSLPDFVGDFTQDLPYCVSCTEGTRDVSGTSFATPRSAGVLSLALLEARRAAGHTGGIVTEDVDTPLLVAGDDLALTGWDLRRALEEAAAVPGPADYDPFIGLTYTAVPVLPVAEALQVGWGLVTEDPERGVVDELRRHLGLVDGEPERVKSGDTCRLMTLNIELRRLYWDNLAPFSDSLGGDADPYVRC